MKIAQPSGSIKDVNRAILRHMAEIGRPVGQGHLGFLLRKDGYSASIPTIGRRLQEMEFEGLLRKISVDGRIVTERGLEALRRWDAEARLQLSAHALLETLRKSDKEHIIELLSARRVIERETAALAAQHASAHDIQILRNILEKQSRAVDIGDLGIREDVSLHLEIARASGNAVLYSIVSLLRSHERYDRIITSMRAAVGTRLVEDHLAIIEGIASHHPHKARDAMDQHLRKLIDDIDRFWHQWLHAELKAGGRHGHQR